MDNLKELESKSAEIIKFLKEELAGIRGGRPTAKLVENIQADYFGQKLAVKQMGSITVVPPREIQITVWDKGATPAIAKAIESYLNATVSAEGNLVRVSLPPLSEERRQELIKIVKKDTEEVRIKIRALRDEILKSVKEQEDKSEITEDDKFNLKDKIQKGIDEANKEIERILDAKIEEISE